MYFKSKKTQLLILAITALVLSRAMFVFFNDPEGPNLLVVTVLAVIVYVVSLASYASKFSNSKKLLLAILIQIALVIVLYFCLK